MSSRSPCQFGSKTFIAHGSGFQQQATANAQGYGFAYDGYLSDHVDYGLGYDEYYDYDYGYGFDGYGYGYDSYGHDYGYGYRGAYSWGYPYSYGWHGWGW